MTRSPKLDLGPIRVDDRVGSRELAPRLQNAILERMVAGDAGWLGLGPDNLPILVGIERKTITDLLDSIDTGRLAGVQLPNLTAAFARVYLVVEGVWRAHPETGQFETRVGKNWAPPYGPRRRQASEVLNYLTSLEEFAGIRVRHSNGISHTAALINALAAWWRKPYTQHTAVLQKHYSALSGGPVALLAPPSLVARVAAELPGVGPKRALAVGVHFPSVRSMLTADAAAWAAVPGLGPKSAATVVDAINKERSYRNGQ